MCNRIMQYKVNNYTECEPDNNMHAVRYQGTKFSEYNTLLWSVKVYNQVALTQCTFTFLMFLPLTLCTASIDFEAVFLCVEL